jgi:hypothetical protein
MRHVHGRFWDPSDQIRKEIYASLTMVDAKDLEWQRLVQSGEWIGRELEEEIDRAKADARRENRDTRLESDD